MAGNLKAAELRRLLAQGEFILAPGIYDGISARVAEFQTISQGGLTPKRGRLEKMAAPFLLAAYTHAMLDWVTP